MASEAAQNDRVVVQAAEGVVRDLHTLGAVDVYCGPVVARPIAAAWDAPALEVCWRSIAEADA